MINYHLETSIEMIDFEDEQITSMIYPRALLDMISGVSMSRPISLC